MSNPEETKQNPAASVEIDYRETPDVTQVHAAIRREHKEPLSEVVPVPLWLMALFGIALFWGGCYLGMFGGGFSSDVYNESAGAPQKSKSGAAGQTAAAVETPVELGKKVFSNCAACHQATGLGMAPAYPPLVGSEFVLGSPKRLAMIVLKGLQGPLKVKGATYGTAVMMPWEKTLNDKKIAAVLTYIRQEWGNSAPPISEEQIAAARKEFKDRAESWTEADILACPADATLEGAAPAAPAAAPGGAAK